MRYASRQPSARRLFLRLLRPAAVRVGRQVQLRHRLAELFQASGRRECGNRTVEVTAWSAWRFCAPAATATWAMSSRTGRRQRGLLSASTRNRWCFLTRTNCQSLAILQRTEDEAHGSEQMGGRVGSGGLGPQCGHRTVYEERVKPNPTPFVFFAAARGVRRRPHLNAHHQPQKIAASALPIGEKPQLASSGQSTALRASPSQPAPSLRLLVLQMCARPKSAARPESAHFGELALFAKAHDSFTKGAYACSTSCHSPCAGLRRSVPVAEKRNESTPAAPPWSAWRTAMCRPRSRSPITTTRGPGRCGRPSSAPMHPQAAPTRLTSIFQPASTARIFTTTSSRRRRCLPLPTPSFLTAPPNLTIQVRRSR